MKKRTIIVGAIPLVERLVSEILANPRSGYRLIGAIGSEWGSDRYASIPIPFLGRLEDVVDVLENHRPQRVIVALDRRDGYLHADRLVEAQSRYDFSIETATDAYEKLTGKLAIESLVPGLVLFSSEYRLSMSTRLCSRVMSLAFALLGFLMSMPFMAVIAAAIKMTSPGPVLFVQERVGLGGKSFKLLKFRSMRQTDSVHSEWESDNLDRITGIGRILRKFRLDELPQFINVVRGDMNIVGPRPHPAVNGQLFALVSRNTPECGDQIPYYSLRSSVRPGITGWAQVRYKYANGLDEEIEKLRYDLYYIKHYSFWLDLRILAETVLVVLFGHRRRNDQIHSISSSPIGNYGSTQLMSSSEKYRLHDSESVPAYSGHPAHTKYVAHTNAQDRI